MFLPLLIPGCYSFSHSADKAKPMNTEHLICNAGWLILSMLKLINNIIGMMKYLRRYSEVVLVSYIHLGHTGEAFNVYVYVYVYVYRSTG